MATQKGDSGWTLSGTSAELLGGVVVCGIDPEDGPPGKGILGETRVG